MTPTETKCISCGWVVQDDKPKSDAKSRFRTAIKYFMFVCGGLTILSLFTNVGASFFTLAALTVLLGLIRSSAEEMLIDREKE
jgi:hypothetical protein